MQPQAISRRLPLRECPAGVACSARPATRAAPGSGTQCQCVRCRALRGKDIERPERLVGAVTPTQLTLQFVRNVGAGDLRKGWGEGFAKNTKDQLPALKDRIATLNSWMADVKSVERLTFTRKPGAGLRWT